MLSLMLWRDLGLTPAGTGSVSFDNADGGGMGGGVSGDAGSGSCRW